VKMARSFLNTEVHLQKGPHRGWVQYDPKFLVVKRAAGPTNSSKSVKPTGNQPPRPGVPTGQPPVPGGTRTSSTPSRTTGRSTAPQAPGARPTTTTTGAASTNATTTTPKKSRVRYVPRPK
jgi:hypothetical protein